MSVENEKVCCNCRHCIREHDEKYDMIVCWCKRHNRYLSYAEVMSGFCKRWAKVKQINRMYENAGIAISGAFCEGYGKEALRKNDKTRN